ncbi:unnamed protein product, partial [Medioppia subpectinata]
MIYPLLTTTYPLIPFLSSAENDTAVGQHIRRSSSGDTSGPDDDQQITADDVIAADEQKQTDNNKTATDEKPIGSDYTQKAVESAKYFGSFIFSAASKARQTVTATAKQVKQTVERAV